MDEPGSPTALHPAAEGVRRGQPFAPVIPCSPDSCRSRLRVPDRPSTLEARDVAGGGDSRSPRGGLRANGHRPVARGGVLHAGGAVRSRRVLFLPRPRGPREPAAAAKPRPVPLLCVARARLPLLRGALSRCLRRRAPDHGADSAGVPPRHGSGPAATLGAGSADLGRARARRSASLFFRRAALDGIAAQPPPPISSYATSRTPSTSSRRSHSPGRVTRLRCS